MTDQTHHDADLHRAVTDEPPAATHYVDERGFLVDQHGRFIDDEGYLLEPGFAVPALPPEGAIDPASEAVVDGRYEPPQPGSEAEPAFDRLEHEGPDRAPISRSRHLRRTADRAAPAIADLVESVRRPKVGPDFVELPAPKRSGHKLGIVLLVVMGLLASVAVGGYVWYQRQVNPPGAPGAAITVDIPQGTSTGGIADILEKKGVISSAQVFEFWLSNHNPGTLQSGKKVFRKNSSFDDAVKVLTRTPETVKIATRVTIPEGFTEKQILDRIAQQVPGTSREELQTIVDSGKIRSSLSPPGQNSLEGLLYPATYDVTEGESAEKLLTQMVATFDQKAAEVGVDQGVGALTEIAGRPITPYEAVTVASLIQSEAGSVEEMPKIATVIYNRLKQGIPLGIDATSKYEASLKGSDELDFESTSPYNTRRVPGIPPTPISSPGAPALQAALNPADGPWIYYVLEAPGKHFFTESTAEFNAAVSRCRANNLGC